MFSYLLEQYFEMFETTDIKLQNQICLAKPVHFLKREPSKRCNFAFLGDIFVLKWDWNIHNFNSALRPRPYKKGYWVLQLYSIANFVTSWLKSLQMIIYVYEGSIEVIRSHLRSFRVIYVSHEATKSAITIDLQCSVSFFVVIVRCPALELFNCLTMWFLEF